LSFVRRQLADCMDHHSSCQISDDNHTYMPTRVLDLGVVDDGDLDISLRAAIRLVESINVTGERTYACLSHRWDTLGRTIVTEQATYEKHKDGIRFEDLGLAYQDTIHIMRRLGMRYLWIDSLCIIQDSARDWEVQSKTMAMVYNKALFTFARQCGSDTSLRCLQNKMFVVSNPSISPPVYARSRFEHWWHPCFPRFPLTWRGWVYQERLLSPRVVHFSDEEVSWECYETVDCQCGVTFGDLSRTNFEEAPKVLHAKALSLDDRTTEPDINALRQRWSEIVQEYTGLNLTQSSDRLHAIQGCVEQMREHLKDSYHFDLWQGNLLKDMAWTADTYLRPGPRLTSQFPIPTWSWASIDSGVWYANMNECFAHARLARELAQGDPFSTQASTILLLTGQLLPASFKLPRSSAPKQYTESDDDMIRIHTDGQHLHGRSESAFLPSGKYIFYPDFDTRVTNRDSEAWYDIVIVRLGRAESDSAQFSLVLWRYGKAIPGSGSERDTVDGYPIYQRIGMLQCWEIYDDPEVADWSKAKTTTIAIE
jgi:hypothetical protein